MQGFREGKLAGCRVAMRKSLQFCRERERACRFAGRESLQVCREGGLAGCRVARRESLQDCRERGPCKFERREGLQGTGLQGGRIYRVVGRKGLQVCREGGLAGFQESLHSQQGRYSQAQVLQWWEHVAELLTSWLKQEAEMWSGTRMVMTKNSGTYICYLGPISQTSQNSSPSGGSKNLKQGSLGDIAGSYCNSGGQ